MKASKGNSIPAGFLLCSLSSMEKHKKRLLQINYLSRDNNLINRPKIDLEKVL